MQNFLTREKHRLKIFKSKILFFPKIALENKMGLKILLRRKEWIS
jgi:hypothetical protein